MVERTRAARAYADGNLEDADYERCKREAGAELATLVVADEEHLLEAGISLETMGTVWERVGLSPRREIAHALFDAVYIDSHTGRVQEYRPKAALLRLLSSLGGGMFGDPDGDRDLDCQQYGLVIQFRPQPRGRSRRMTSAAKVALPVSLWHIVAERVHVSESLRALAREYGVSRECIRRIAHGG